MPPIDARTQALALIESFKKNTRSGFVNILLTGESGFGKTMSAMNAPKPVHIDSFDPGGARVLREGIEKGDVIPDIAYENEDPMNPTAFSLWEKTFKMRVRNGYFNNIGTYFLDSATTWTEAIMNYIQGRTSINGKVVESRAGQVPDWNKDYYPQKILIRNYLRAIMKLPCHFVFTAHLNTQKDTEGNVIARRVMFSGQGAITIPLLFDEIWVVTKRRSPDKKMRFLVRTQADGMYQARSRLAELGRLEEEEENNLTNILKKVGHNWQDKPSFINKESSNGKS